MPTGRFWRVHAYRKVLEGREGLGFWRAGACVPERGQRLQVDDGYQEAPEGRPIAAAVAQAWRAAWAQAVVGAEQVSR